MAATPKFPEAKSRGLVDLLLLFSFPKGNWRGFLFSLGCARQPKQMLHVGFLLEIGSFMAWFLESGTFARKFGILLGIFTSRSAIWTALARFTIFGALMLAVRPWIAPVLLLTFIFQVRTALMLAERSIVPFRKLHSSVQWGCTLYPYPISRVLLQTLNISV